MRRGALSDSSELQMRDTKSNTLQFFPLHNALSNTNKATLPANPTEMFPAGPGWLQLDHQCPHCHSQVRPCCGGMGIIQFLEAEKVSR